MEDLPSENWKTVQTKTFTKWVNNKLKKADFPCIADLFTDLSSGIALVNLLHSLGKNITRYNTNPFSRIQKMENMTIILEFIREQGISLVNIGPEDIVDGNQKLILGLIWTLISRMSISDILNSEFFTMKEELLGWAQRVTEKYKNLEIKDLTTSWQNGIGFNAIIHRFRPELVPDFFTLNPANSYQNCEKAFQIAEESLDIPKLFDAEDIIDVLKPDEKSVLTYLSQFYQKFQEEERLIAVKDRLRNILMGLDWSLDAKNSYEKRATAFIDAKISVYESIDRISSQVKKLIAELKRIEEVNTKLIGESTDLHLLLNDIQDVHRIYNLKPYFPPDDLSIDKLNMCYLNLSTILDLNSLRSVANEFENGESVELVRLKDVSNQIYSIHDKEAQVSMLESSEMNFKPVHFASKNKQETHERLRMCFESKKNKLEKYISLKKSTDGMVEEAKKMFKIKDVKRSGVITISDFKRIVRALGFEPNFLDSSVVSEDGIISCDRMCDILRKISFSNMNRSQIEKAFGEIGVGEKLRLSDIIPDYTVKSLSSMLDESGCISFCDVMKYIDE